ncbi:MAG: hypothetical protein M9894_18695 [Planctomycetes bacterium]|nr:hypothetical protein [Planctomycetota bacterium]
MADPVLLWGGALALLAAYALTRAAPPGEPPPAGRSPSRRDAAVLLGVAALVVACRAPLAIGRAWRNPDEFAYLALARFAADSGESLLSCMGHLRLHMLLYRLGDGRTFVVVDLVTSFVVGLTAAALGALVLQRTGRVRVAALTAALYPVGLLPFEGLSSNGEPWAGLGLAIYLLARLGAAGPVAAAQPVWRAVGAGSGLALAAMCKEHALTFVAVEPLLLVLVGPRGSARAVARHAAGLVAGAALVLGPLLLVLAWHGVLGRQAQSLLATATGLGAESDGSLVTLVLPAPSPLPGAGVATVLLAGLTRLLHNPVTWLALVGVALVVARGAADQRRLLAALAVPFFAGVATASLGLRFFDHYFMLALPAGAPLAALALARLREDLRRHGRAAAALVLLAALPGVPRLARATVAAVREGPPEHLRDLGPLRAALPAGPRLFVAGWSPELYHLLDRTPASRRITGVTGTAFGWGTVEKDLARHPLAPIVVPPTVALPLWRRGEDGAVGFHWLKLDAFEESPAFERWVVESRLERRRAGAFAVYVAAPR